METTSKDHLLLLYEARQNDISTAIKKLEHAVSAVSDEVTFSDGELSLSLLQGDLNFANGFQLPVT